VGERRDIGSPPDDAGHTGSTTTPEQTMIDREVGLGPAPQLMHDRQKVPDSSGAAVGVVPLLAAGLILLILILIVFMPR
jgi:hypothetical protein